MQSTDTIIRDGQRHAVIERDVAAVLVNDRIRSYYELPGLVVCCPFAFSVDSELTRDRRRAEIQPRGFFTNVSNS